MARLATRLLPDVAGRLPASSKTIYLTFDDGPSPCTAELLDLLHPTNAGATFFLRGDRVELRPSLAERILAAGHGIGNHSYRHLDAWRNRWSLIRDDLERADRTIAAATGTVPLWVRPPFGRLRRQTRIWCRSGGHLLALWDVMAGDFYKDAAENDVVDGVVSQVRPGSILVLHDGDEQQPRALRITERLLRTLGESGWMFEKLPGRSDDGAG